MDDEECDDVAVITTGPIKDVVLSNFPYLETNGNGCVTPTSNNYSYMGGCYLKGSSQSGKDIFYLMMNEMSGMDNNTITTTFFDSDGNFIEIEFENYVIPLLAQEEGVSEEEIRQMIEQAGKTLFECYLKCHQKSYLHNKQ